MNFNALFSILIFIAVISGCTVKGDYACGVPENGVRCQPMDKTHEQLYDGTLNSLHTEPFPDENEVSSTSTASTEHVGDSDYSLHAHSSTTDAQDHVNTSSHLKDSPSIKTIYSKQAILSQPREMRIWFDRFTDADGDLHDESFVFIRIDNGHWIIDDKPVLY